MTAPRHPQPPYERQGPRPPYPGQPYRQDAYPQPHPGRHAAPPHPQPVHHYRPPVPQPRQAQPPYGRHQVEEPPRPHRRPPAPYHDEPVPQPEPRRHRLGALAWSALILGIVGVVGSPIIILNNLTAVVAGVGAVLGVIALFGTRKVLAVVGVAVSVAAIVFTVTAQSAAVAELDRALGGLSGDDPAAMADVTVRDCAVVDRGYGLVVTEGTIEITNGTGESQSYMVTVSVDDATGARVGEINAIANSLAAGQRVVLSGADATGTATEQADAGPAACTVANVRRFGG